MRIHPSSYAHATAIARRALDRAPDDDDPGLVPDAIALPHDVEGCNLLVPLLPRCLSLQCTSASPAAITCFVSKWVKSSQTGATCSSVLQEYAQSITDGKGAERLSTLIDISFEFLEPYREMRRDVRNMDVSPGPYLLISAR